METETLMRPSLMIRLRHRLRILEAQAIPDEAAIALNRAKIKILEADGFALLHALVDRTGKDSGAVRLKTRFGFAWKLPGGDWVSDKAMAFRRHGLKLALVKRTAWARLSEGQVIIYPVAANYTRKDWE